MSTSLMSSVPLALMCTWLVLGMLTTMSAWATMSDELEIALSEEEEDVQPILRVLLTVFFVVAWPVVVVDLMQRR